MSPHVTDSGIRASVWAYSNEISNVRLGAEACERLQSADNRPMELYCLLRRFP